MKGFCGADCDACIFGESCKGCAATGGSPFGGCCIAAEYIKHGGEERFQLYKEDVLREINALGIDGMPEIRELFCLCGAHVNLQYPLPSGIAAAFLKDEDVYLGTQAVCAYTEAGCNRCFGIVVGLGFILVSEYGPNGSTPELVLYKRR